MINPSGRGGLNASRFGGRHGRLAAVAVAGAGLSLALAACSTSATTSESTDGASDGGGSTEQTVLKVYGWKGNDAEPANITEINEAFEAAHPEITLDYEFVPANDAYLQRVQPELLAGEGADVIMTDPTKVADWAKAGYLKDISDSSWVGDMQDTVTPFVSFDGNVYATPTELIPIGLFANMDQLAEVGITEVPETFPEFTAAMDKLKDAGMTPLALPNKAGNTGAWILNGIAATLVYNDNPDWDQQFMDGEVSFEDWRGSIEQMMSLEEDGYIDYKTELGNDEWANGAFDFAAGKNTFMLQGSWVSAGVVDAGLDNFQIAPWPAGPDGTQSNNDYFVGVMWSVNANTEVEEAARAYVDFWADADNALPFLESERAQSPWVGGANPEDAATAPTVAALEDGRNRILANTTWYTESGRKAMESAIQSLQLGQIDIDEFIATLDEQLRP
ncbi:ABC transporter substrate-binding protein [Demequina rhizosphaerae]|uniref:ABC transporter substrate-binding protein n=1 Tax=Demequina rhizosphaerae TaxID=1638985 RepID=UPI000783E6C1|nr:extracellular solute-binding protein [Demequina rhizosphaerae]